MAALLSAYRIGARVAWEHMSARAVSAGVSTAQLVSLAESIFVYIDELSGASVQGHASQAGMRDVQRSRLVELLIEGAVLGDPLGVQAAADAVGWTIPERMAVAVVPLPPGREPTPPADVLALIEGSEAIAILPDPSGPGRRRRLERAWEGTQVFVGTVRPPAQAPVSLAHARRMQRLVAQGRVPDTKVVAAADHLPELVVGADVDLLAELEERVRARTADLEASNRELLAAHQRADRVFAAYAGALPGKVLDGRYRLDEQLGAGGFGAVFRGRHLVLACPVAVKVFRPAGGNDSAAELQRRRPGTICPNSLRVTFASFGVPFRS